MPAVRTKQYLVVTTAGAGALTGPNVRPAPAGPVRVSLLIQNTGANPGLFRFDGAVRNDGSDITVAAGAFLPIFWSEGTACPNESLNFASLLATKWAVIEGVTTP
jgi:hypothetical protein